MKCGKCKFKINIGSTEETGDAFCSRLGRDTAYMTARENDKVY